MPKELIHFKVAERTAGLLNDTRFAPCLETHRAGLLLGAVFHDALFYAVLPKGRPLEALAHRFHGVHGHDPYDLVRIQIEQIKRSEDRHLPAALLVGMVSHLFADAAMHPMVWHHTGDYYHADGAARSLARQRHRAMEGLMDRVACPEMFGKPKYYLRHLLRRCPAMLSHGLPVDGLASMTGLDRKTSNSQLGAAWILFAILQRACAMRPLAWGLFAMRPVLPAPAREVVSLFHAPQLMKQAGFLTHRIDFIHPVSGEPHRDTLEELQRQAAQRAAACCRQLEDAVFGDSKAVFPEAAPSLETGQTGIPASRMLNFATPLFPNLE